MPTLAYLPLSLDDEIEIASFSQTFGLDVTMMTYGLSSHQIKHLEGKRPSSLLLKDQQLRDKERDLKILEGKLQKKRSSIGRHKRKFNEFLVMEELVKFV